MATTLSAVPRPVAGARQARDELGVGRDAPLPDILKLIEEAAGIPVTLLPLSEGVAGAYGREDERPYIFVNSCTHPVRRRFTLAHEFGHHALGHAGMIDLETDIYGSSTVPREREANAFAAEFLAPLQAVQNWVEARGRTVIDLTVVVELAHYFGISAGSARYRLTDARYLQKPREVQSIHQQIQGGEHHRERARLGLEELVDAVSLQRTEIGGFRPSKAIQLDAMRAFEYGVLGLDEIAAALGHTPAEVEEAFRGRGIEPLQDESDF